VYNPLFVRVGLNSDVVLGVRSLLSGLRGESSMVNAVHSCFEKSNPHGTLPRTQTNLIILFYIFWRRRGKEGFFLR
jgi:hypothetical protein